MAREAWCAAAHGVTNSRTRLTEWTELLHTYMNNVRIKGFSGGLVVKNLPANAGDEALIPGSARSPGQQDPLENEMATHSSTPAWETPWAEEPGRLQSMGSQRVWHDLATKQQCTHYVILLDEWMSMNQRGKSSFMLVELFDDSCFFPIIFLFFMNF